jgi:Family of unknown function (DUF6010)
MHHLPLSPLDYIGPAVASAIFIAIMSSVNEPARRTWHAVILAGAGGVYLSGGFGPWELIYPLVATPVAYAGLRSYRFIGIGWLMHSCWDIVHHLWGNPIWPFMPTSAFGCMVFDAVIAVWFIAGVADSSSAMRVFRERLGATRAYCWPAR